MVKTYQLPKGPVVQENRLPSTPYRGYLIAIQNLTEGINAVSNLDSGTSYTNDQMRDKIIEVISALQGG